MTQRRLVGLGITALFATIIGYLTLSPAPDPVALAGTHPWCIAGCDDVGLLDAILNVVMFMPLGFGLALVLSRRWQVVLVCFCATVAIETAQAGFIVGRDPSLRDILCNTLGGALGTVVASSGRYLVWPTPSLAKRLALVAGGGWLLLLAATATTLQRSLPATTYWGQWAAQLAQFDTFPGTVISARVGELPVANGRLANSGAIRAVLAQDSFEVEVQAVTGAPTEGLAPIFSIFDSEQRLILLVGQKGADLRFQISQQNVSLGIRPVPIALEGFAGYEPGSSIRIRAGMDHSTLRLSASSGERTSQVSRPLSVGWGWVSLSPWERPVDHAARIFTALWLGALLFGSGYWTTQALRFPVSAGWLVGLLLAGLLVLPFCFGFRPAHWSEWAGSAAGAGSGVLAAVWARRGTSGEKVRRER